MVTIRHLELAEELFDIEPSVTYPARAAAIVAQLAGAAAHRVVVEGTDAPPSGAEPRGEGLSVPLKFGKADLGMLQLWFQDGHRGEDQQRIARWGGRMLARGLAYSRRISVGSKEIDIAALLAGTPLTPRERDVVGRLVSGHSTREISQSTGLTVATVNTYLKRIFAKLGVHSRVELLARVTGTRNAVWTPMRAAAS
jgi:DNA-binding CsgD family transcriptional regulator